jgi:protein involved in polysaccharide export with SLBB domain
VSARLRSLVAVLALAAAAAAAGPARAQGSLPDPAMIEAARQAGAGTPRTADPSLQRAAAPLPGRVDPKRYRVGPGDVFRIAIWGRVTRGDDVSVGPEGTMVIPGAGTVQLDGLTLEEARLRILQALERELRNVQMDVRLTRARGFLIYRTGQVREPGAAEANAFSRVSDVLPVSALAENASRRRVEIHHRDGSREVADLELFLLTGDPALNPYLRDGDILQVPVATEFIQASGALARPGRYELGPRDSLRTLLRLAGDPVPAASADRALLVRWPEPFRPDSLWIQLGDIYSGNVNPPLSDGDRFYAFFVPRYHEQPEAAIYGEVARPGAYPIVEGTTRMSDLVRSAEGFLPEGDLSAIRIFRRSPAANEKDPELDRLLRLSRNDLTASEYEKLRTKLAALREDYRLDWKRVQELGPEVDLLLRQGDVIRVDKLVSSIRVDGEVRHPGILAYQAGLSFDDYIEQAGGYANRAWRGKVRVTRSVTGQTLYAQDVPALGPGDFVWVPEKPDRDWGRAGLTLLTVLATISTIALAAYTIGNN